MANTITNSIGLLHEALTVVDDKFWGLSLTVDRNSSVDRVALNQTINVFDTPAIASATITPAATAPQPSDVVLTNRTVTIDNIKKVPWYLTGEEQLSLDNGGSGAQQLQRNFILNAMQTHLEDIDNLIALEHVNAARAVIPDGTELFDAATKASADFANVVKVLDEEGAPQDGRALVLSLPSANLMMKNSAYMDANTSGSSESIRNGTMMRTMGLDIHKSAAIITTFTKGDLTSDADLDATEPVGETSLSIDAGGTGGVVVGDIVNIGGKTNYYVVSTANADLDTGNLDLNEPGLLIQGEVGDIVVVQDSSVRNMAYSRDAIILATRIPNRSGALGDGAIVQSQNGIAFELVAYQQYNQVAYELTVAYGVTTVNPRHMCLLVT